MNSPRSIEEHRASGTGALPLWQVIVIALVAVYVLSLPVLMDPMIRHDDYPALFAEPHLFWKKTLHEGRWLNYFWHLRGIVTPAWLNFAVYQALWAVLAATIAVYATRRETHPLFVITLTLFILSSALSTLISLWFNTLILGLAVVVLYAVLGGTLSLRTHRMLLPIFVILSFSAYTTYPVILLAVCLVQTKHRSVRDLFALLALFVFSIAAAVLVTYALNWQIHGVFGVPLADWRNATPAHDLAGLAANLPIVMAAALWLADSASYALPGIPYIHLGLSFFATVVLIRNAPLEALYLLMGLLAGIGLVVSQILMTGATTPPRAFIFVWIFYAIIAVRATAILSVTPNLAGRFMRNFTLLVALCDSLLMFRQYVFYRPWLAETRELAVALQDADPAISRPLLVYGDVMTLDNAKAAHVQSSKALTSRVRQLSGHEAILCFDKPNVCDDVIEARRLSGQAPALTIQIETNGGGVRLGDPM